MEQHHQQQFNKKDRNRLKKQEKENKKEVIKRRRLFKKYSMWFIYLILFGVVVFGIVWFSSQPESVRPGQSIPIQGREHISENSETPIYNSNPPTSGSHSGPIKGGFYGNEIKDINAVHNLEHGFVWISYKDIDDETRSMLEEIGKKFSGSVIVSKREANDSKIAIASWGRLEKMDGFNEELIVEFIKRNKNRSPERLAR